MTKKEHKRRIVSGLIAILEADLNGNGASYVFEDSEGRQLSEPEVGKAVQVGEELLKRLKSMIR